MDEWIKKIPHTHTHTHTHKMYVITAIRKQRQEDDKFKVILGVHNETVSKQNKKYHESRNKVP
jgi:hypothetical protein